MAPPRRNSRSWRAGWSTTKRASSNVHYRVAPKDHNEADTDWLSRVGIAAVGLSPLRPIRSLLAPTSPPVEIDLAPPGVAETLPGKTLSFDVFPSPVRDIEFAVSPTTRPVPDASCFFPGVEAVDEGLDDTDGEASETSPDRGPVTRADASYRSADRDEASPPSVLPPGSPPASSTAPVEAPASPLGAAAPAGPRLVISSTATAAALRDRARGPTSRYDFAAATADDLVALIDAARAAHAREDGFESVCLACPAPAAPRRWALSAALAVGSPERLGAGARRVAVALGRSVRAGGAVDLLGCDLAVDAEAAVVALEDVGRETDAHFFAPRAAACQDLYLHAEPALSDAATHDAPSPPPEGPADDSDAPRAEPPQKPPRAPSGWRVLRLLVAVALVAVPLGTLAPPRVAGFRRSH